VLTIKAGMWFCFKGIVLATPPSIKDSDGDPRGSAARPPSSRKRRCRTHEVRLGPVAEGLKRKPESVRKQKGNRNVITLSRFLWLEQWRDRQRCRPQPVSPWEQWILRKRAFWAGACHPRFLVRLLETVKCRNSRARAGCPRPQRARRPRYVRRIGLHFYVAHPLRTDPACGETFARTTGSRVACSSLKKAVSR
jgi:hypothetical protein